MLGAFQESFLREKDGLERTIHGDTVGLGRLRNMAGFATLTCATGSEDERSHG